MNYKTFWDKKNTPFLILHGWGGSSESWVKVGQILWKDFFVIIPDIPCATKDVEWWRNDVEWYKSGYQDLTGLQDENNWRWNDLSVCRSCESRNLPDNSELRTENLELRNNKKEDPVFDTGWHQLDNSESNLDSQSPKSLQISKSPCDKVYTLDDYADLIKDFIDELGLKDFVLLGHSNGWAIASKLVTKYSDLPIKKLILNNSAWIRKDRKRSLKRRIFWVISKIVKPIFSLPWMWKVRNLFYRVIGGHDYLEAEKNPNKKQTYLNMINSDLQDVFPQIEKDTLLIWWENDTYTPLSDGQKINNLIKNSKLVIIPNVRHGIHLQKPDELVKVILENL